MGYEDKVVKNLQLLMDKLEKEFIKDKDSKEDLVVKDKSRTPIREKPKKKISKPHSFLKPWDRM